MGKFGCVTRLNVGREGSYLNSSAQEKLCNKIKSISEKDGVVIYCTHSHHLLNPNYIPLNKIYIVEKDRKKNIKTAPINKIPIKSELITAYQPILDALQIPAFDIYDNTTPIVVVEGIYDMYAMEIFTELDFEYNVLPSVCANSIVKNIQYLIAFSKKYIAIWDNDEEGEKEYKRACRSFGEYESKKFDKLPLKSMKKRRMEEMFESLRHILK